MGINVSRYTRQRLVYWQKKKSDRQGQNTYFDPVEYPCRWDDGDAQVEMQDGRVLTFDGYIILDPVTAPNVKKGGLVFLGTLDAVKAMGVQMPTVPDTNQGVREIKRIRRTTGFKGEQKLIEVWV